MKKIVGYILVLMVLLSSLTACTFTQNASGAFIKNAESSEKIEKMMSALAEENITDAQALMHPESTKDFDDAISQMSDYIDGREVTSMELININVNTSTGTSGKSREEQVVYKVTLDDNDVIYLNVDYLSNNEGTGFTSFQLVLGVV